MSDDGQRMDDEQGNCKQCGHPFDPHIVTAFDVTDFSKGGRMHCPVNGCTCESSITFNLKHS